MLFYSDSIMHSILFYILNKLTLVLEKTVLFIPASKYPLWGLSIYLYLHDKDRPFYIDLFIFLNYIDNATKKNETVLFKRRSRSLFVKVHDVPSTPRTLFNSIIKISESSPAISYSFVYSNDPLYDWLSRLCIPYTHQLSYSSVNFLVWNTISGLCRNSLKKCMKQGCQHLDIGRIRQLTI